VSSIGRRIVVIGNTNAGKSTLAGQLAERLAIPFVELDALFWQPNWVESEDDVFRARVAEATAGDAWVVAGNYTARIQDLVWPRAETVIFLDYSLPLVLRRTLTRSWKRWRTHELLWGTNTENFWKHFTSWNDSLFAWAVKSHGKHRDRWPEFVADPRWAGTRFLRFCAPRETNRWLDAVAPAVGRRR
jgi:adenylate kinase family enzyme